MQHGTCGGVKAAVKHRRESSLLVCQDIWCLLEGEASWCPGQKARVQDVALNELPPAGEPQ